MIITLHITHVKNLHISYLRFKDTMETSMTQNTIHMMFHFSWSCSMYKISISFYTLMFIVINFIFIELQYTFITMMILLIINVPL